MDARPGPLARPAKRPLTPSALPLAPARCAAPTAPRPYTIVRASPLPSDGAIPANIAWRANNWGALNATHNVATVTNGLTSSSPNSPPSGTSPQASSSR